jgi:hypothetical protein
MRFQNSTSALAFDALALAIPADEKSTTVTWKPCCARRIALSPSPQPRSIAMPGSSPPDSTSSTSSERAWPTQGGVPDRYQSSNQCEVRAKNAYISVVSTQSRPVSPPDADQDRIVWHLNVGEYAADDGFN